MVQLRACVTSDGHFECVRWVHQTTVTTGKRASRSHHLRACEEEQLMQGVPSIRGSPEAPQRVRDVDRATHVLHIDIAGPYIESHEGHHYFLVGALLLPDRPLLIDARLLKRRTSIEVCAALERRTLFLRVSLLKGLRSQIHPASRGCTLTGQESLLPCTFRSSCPITAASIIPSPQGMTHRLTEQQEGLWGS